MLRRLIINATISLGVLASMIGGTVQVSAQAPSPSQFDVAWSTLQKGLAQTSIQSSMKSMVGASKSTGAGRMRAMTMAERKAAALRQPGSSTGVTERFAGINPATAAHSPLKQATGSITVAGMKAPARRPSATRGSVVLADPDYFGNPNWAISPLPTIDNAGNVTGGMRKFVDTLPQLSLPTTNTVTGNNLGQYIPVADADTTSFSGTNAVSPTIPAADYYEIGLVEYREQLHSDLPATLLRGYVQIETPYTTHSKHVPLLDTNGISLKNPRTNAPLFGVDKPSYLGPVILATKNRPVRVKFTNFLPTGAGGELFIPTDTTYMGAGAGPDGTPYTENRADLHLHGGNSPWISDGTPNQWTAPFGETTNYPKGVTVGYVPDMWFDASGNALAACSQQITCTVPGASTNPGNGSLTYYWTNQQGGRLMFYHDHSDGTTRLNVYAGEAAGYLLNAPAEENLLADATVPGAIGDGSTVTHTADLAHVIPLVIQDRGFVPDAGQLAAQDPTWDTVQYGAKGNLWFPHVYTPNQNPADLTGANAFGRWDYGPWFWPPQDPTTLVSQPYECSSAFYPDPTAIAFPPLVCPGIPNPSGVPEGFMDTPLVNGTAFPSVSVDPAAYRFRILSAGNDRTWNLGLYVADPLRIALTNGGSGYSITPTVVISPVGSDAGGATATVRLSKGAVTQILITTVGAGYNTAPNVTITDTGAGVGATANAVIDPITGQVIRVDMSSVGSGYTAPVVTIDPPAGCVSGCVTAQGSAVVVPSGTLIGIGVANNGAVWTANPVISIVPAPGDVTGAGAKAIASVNTEVKMVDAAPNGDPGRLPDCAINPGQSGAQLAMATLDQNGNPINGTGLDTNCWPATYPTDGRDGGVPDPTTAGPPIIQIGTEGGLLPAAVVIPSTPNGYEYNRRSITVLNIWTHGLLLGPAERADVVVDFSRFAGKTLILYNDAPAPVPAFDSRTDYYTGDPDQTLMGGAPTTMPGYGPNTRTVMQIKVAATAAHPNVVPFKLKSLTTALPNIFAATQDQIILPEPGYPVANGGGATNYARIQDTTIPSYIGTGSSLGGLYLTAGGDLYTAVPTVTVNGGGGQGAKAVATLMPAPVASFKVTVAGAGYITAPLVTISGGGGAGAQATAVLSRTSISAINIISGGAGYSGVVSVTIGAPSAGGVQATATATISSKKINKITIVNPGSGYLSIPSVLVTPPGGCVLNTSTCIRATASAVLSPTGVASLNLVSGGINYTSAPTVTLTAPPGNVAGRVTAAAKAVMAGVPVASVTMTSGGAGYKYPATISFVRGVGDTTGYGATAALIAPQVPLQAKTIQELFTLDYGRMNATLGVEIPKTNFNVQTTIPLGYQDPPTEILQDGQVQIWKITHNGVDTHFIHFHLINVQVINRVGWDGAIKAPDVNELSWKDTVRMNPLEDIIVALLPLHQNLPWDLPNSVHLLDVTRPAGSTMGFSNIDPANNPVTVVNKVVNFGYEYVWHCHILGHEENDMMRPMILGVPPRQPGTPVVSLTGTGAARRPVVKWADNSLNETSFTVQRSANGGTTWITPTIGVVGQNVTVLTDTTAVTGMGYLYRVVANNLVGDATVYAAPAVGYPSANFPSASTAASTVITP